MVFVGNFHVGNFHVVVFVVFGFVFGFVFTFAFVEVVRDGIAAQMGKVAEQRADLARNIFKRMAIVDNLFWGQGDMK